MGWVMNVTNLRKKLFFQDVFWIYSSIYRHFTFTFAFASVLYPLSPAVTFSWSKCAFVFPIIGRCRQKLHFATTFPSSEDVPLSRVICPALRKCAIIMTSRGGLCPQSVPIHPDTPPIALPILTRFYRADNGYHNRLWINIMPSDHPAVSRLKSLKADSQNRNILLPIDLPTRPSALHYFVEKRKCL